nr:hypothetical protein [Rathayibacter caricis]
MQSARLEHPEAASVQARSAAENAAGCNGAALNERNGGKREPSASQPKDGSGVDRRSKIARRNSGASELRRRRDSVESCQDMHEAFHGITIAGCALT